MVASGSKIKIYFRPSHKHTHTHTSHTAQFGIVKMNAQDNARNWTFGRETETKKIRGGLSGQSIEALTMRN